MTDLEIRTALNYLNGYLRPFEMFSDYLCFDASVSKGVHLYELEAPTLEEHIEKKAISGLNYYYGKEDSDDKWVKAKWEEFKKLKINFIEEEVWQPSLEAFFEYSFGTSMGNRIYDHTHPFKPPRGYYSQLLVRLIEDQFKDQRLSGLNPDQDTQDIINLAYELGGRDYFLVADNRILHFYIGYD